MIRFGTDGIRGAAGRGAITAEAAVAVGRAAARWAREQGGGTVVVGRDTRPSGPMLAAGVLAGVSAEGLEARLAGVVPTSAVAVAVGSGTGVVITASHNPPADNGFKVLGPGGRKPDDDDTARLEAWIAASPGPATPGDVVGAVPAVQQLYRRSLARALGDLGALRARRIAVDLANGAAFGLGAWLEEHLPGEVVLLGAAQGPINEGCGVVHPERLARAVVAEGCDAGFAVDGDADRCVLVDERGTVVPGDALAWRLIRDLGVRRAAVTVMSNAALEPALPGVDIVRTPVGDRHLQARILAGEVTLGAEESGHVLFADGLPTGDGILTGLRALKGLFAHHDRASAAFAGFEPFPRRLVAVEVAERPPLGEIDALQQAVREGEAALGEGGRVFLRYSGTEPVLRILVEGADDGAVEQVTRSIASVAEEVLA